MNQRPAKECRRRPRFQHCNLSIKKKNLACIFSPQASSLFRAFCIPLDIRTLSRTEKKKQQSKSPSSLKLSRLSRKPSSGIATQIAGGGIPDNFAVSLVSLREISLNPIACQNPGGPRTMPDPNASACFEQSPKEYEF